MLRKNLQIIFRTFPKLNNDQLTFAKVYHPNLFIKNSYSSQKHIVQMRGLDAEAKEEDVIDFFKSLNIKPIHINMKCDSAGRVTGTTEVEFASHAEAVVAMRKRTAFIGNRFIRLTIKSETGEDLQSDVNNILNKVPEKKQVLFKDGVLLEGNIERSSFPTGHFIRMKNIPNRITEQAIFQFFWPINVTPVSVKALYDDNGRRTGEFDVEFLNHDDAVRAMSKNNAFLGNKFVELALNSAPTPVPRNALDKEQTNLIMQNTDSVTNTEQSLKGG